MMQPLAYSLLFIVSLSSVNLGNCLLTSEAGAPALYVFGDSIVDSGNNNWLYTFAKVAYPPYGRDFRAGIPTGRVTNGKIIPDLLADHLGLPYPRRVKDPMPPYGSLTGYNYASAGGGILPETGPPNVLNLTRQVNLFGRTLENVLTPRLGDQLEYHLSNSIFFLWIGNNDYLLNYFNKSSDSSDKYTPEEFSDLLVEKYSEQLQLLHGMGARKIVVFEVAPLGCIPFYVKNIEEGCDDLKNEIAQEFNAKLHAMIQNLAVTLDNPYFTFGKTFDLCHDAIKNPSNYGLTNVRRPCCPVVRVNGVESVPCIPTLGPIGQVCENRDQYLFWDAAHPTQVGYEILASRCITNSTICTPYSIDALAQLTINPTASLHNVA